jgi:hypothetical protein
MDINIEAHHPRQANIGSRTTPPSLIRPLNSHPLMLSNKKQTQTHLAQISYPPNTNTNTNILHNHPPNPILQEHQQPIHHQNQNLNQINTYNNGLANMNMNMNMNIGYNGHLQHIKFIYNNRIKITKTLHLHGLTV